MNKDACDTLKTRMAYHYLKDNEKIDTYISYLKNEITRDELWESVSKEIINSVINEEISEYTIESLYEKTDKLKGDNKIDIIIGGPPCQAYSIAGRARDPESMKSDPRIFLYKYYLGFIKRYTPKMFVFENVPGILSAKNGVHLENILYIAI